VIGQVQKLSTSKNCHFKNTPFEKCLSFKNITTKLTTNVVAPTSKINDFKNAQCEKCAT
jgi:hypothetical protein